MAALSKMIARNSLNAVPKIRAGRRVNPAADDFVVIISYRSPLITRRGACGLRIADCGSAPRAVASVAQYEVTLATARGADPQSANQNTTAVAPLLAKKIFKVLNYHSPRG